MEDKMRWEKLRDYLCEYYTFEFQNIPEEVKFEKINYVLQCNAQIFTREYFDNFSCIKCGYCCRRQNCVYFDEETNLCTTHDNLPYIICETYPWGLDEYGIVSLDMNCAKLMKGLHFYFDYIFTKMEQEILAEE